MRELKFNETSRVAGGCACYCVTKTKPLITVPWGTVADAGVCSIRCLIKGRNWKIQMCV